MPEIDKAQLRELFMRDPALTNQQIADMIGVDRRRVSKWRNKWRGEVPQSPQRQTIDSAPDDSEFIRWHEQRVSVPRQARMTGLKLKRVQRIRQRLGLRYTDPAVQPYPPEMHAKVEAMLDDGASFAEIRRTLKVSDHFLRDHWPGRGWTPQQAVAHKVMLREARKAGVDL